jgi:hypothetical protein
MVYARAAQTAVQCIRGFACHEKQWRLRPYQLVLTLETLAVPKLENKYRMPVSCRPSKK